MDRNLQQEAYQMTIRVNNVIQSTLLSCSARLRLIVNMTNLIQIAKMQNTATAEEEEVIINAFERRKWNLDKFIERIWDSIPGTNKLAYINYCRAVHRAGKQSEKNTIPTVPPMQRYSVPDRHEVLLQAM